MRTQVLALVAELAGRKRDNIKPEQRLEADLGITGDSAGALMRQLEMRFDVDLTGFVFPRFFAEESSDLLRPALVAAARTLSPSFRNRWDRALAAEREITVAHLLKVVEARHWIDPDANAERASASGGFRMIFASLAALFLIAAPVIFAVAAVSAPPAQQVQYLGGAGFFLAVFAYMAHGSWRSIQRKLASAPG